MKRSAILVLPLLVLLTGTLLLSSPFTSHAAEEIYVDVINGSDQDGDGSQSNPYKTITKAVGIADSSTTHTKIYLESGVYSSDSGEDFPLTLDNIDLIGDPDDPTQVEVSGEITVSNGEITGIQFYQTLTAEEDALIQKNRFTGIDGWAAYVLDTSTVKDNVFENNNRAIILNIERGPIEISNNSFIKNHFAISGDLGVEDVLIDSNQIEAPNDAGIYINLNQESYELVIRNNEISVYYNAIDLDLSYKGEVLIEKNDILGEKSVRIGGESSATVDMGGGPLGSSGFNIFQSTNSGDYYNVKNELPAYSGTIYAKNNAWKDSSGNEFQPPEVLEGPADTDYFYIKNTGNKIRFSGTEDTTPPDTTITSGPSGEIDHRDVTFEWTGSDDVTATSDLTYSYVLEGVDSDWSDWTSDTSTSYSDLSNGNYTFKVKAKDEAGNIDSTPPEKSFSLTDDTPPALITDFTASDNEDAQSTLTWTNPTDSDLDKVIVRRKTSSFPTDNTDGDLVYEETSPTPDSSVSYTDTDITNSTIYYYTVFSKDNIGNWNNTVEKGSNADTAKPLYEVSIDVDSSGWSMVSIPVKPGNGDPTAVFSKMNNPNMIFHWNPELDSGEGDYLTPDTGYDQVDPLNGMWIHLEDTEAPKSFPIKGIHKSSRELTLAKAGWHQIGIQSNYVWNDLGVKQGTDGATLSVSEQADGPDAPHWISRFIWEWDNSASEYIAYDVSTSAKSLEPDAGYWVRSRVDDVTLVIPYLEPPSTPSAANQPEGISSSKFNAKDIPTPPVPPTETNSSESDMLDVQAGPNPAKSDQIEFEVTGIGIDRVKVNIYDSSGETVYESPFKEGQQITWNLTDNKDSKVQNGIYLYQVEARGADGVTRASEIQRLLVLQ